MRKKLNEVRDMASMEISSKVNELKLDLAKERSLNASGSKPENPGKIRKLRRKIAQMLTILSEKEIRKEKNSFSGKMKTGEVNA